MTRLHVVWMFVIFAVITCSDFLVLIITLPIMYMAGRELSRIKDKGFTSADMFWFCILLYFGIVPAQSFNDGHFGKSTTAVLSFSYLDLVIAMGVVLLFCATFLLAKKRALKYQSVRKIDRKYSSHTGYLVFLFVCSIAGMIGFVVFSGGLSNVLSARVDKSLESHSVIGALCLAFAVAANFFLIDIYKNSKTRFIALYAILTICLGAQLICLNPYNSARFFLLGSWLPIVLLIIDGKVSYKNVYMLIAFGIFVVMPVLSITTRYGTQGSDDFVVDFSDLFTIKDVDIFETLVYMINYVEHVGYQFGQNLLAILLFFVPRDLWNDKPIVGGLSVGWELYNKGVANTPNLSFFIGGDLFMDFSWWGVAIGGYCLGYLFYKYTIKTNRYSEYYIEGFVLISVLPILLRGPVGAVIGYPLCLFICTRLFNVFKQTQVNRLVKIINKR